MMSFTLFQNSSTDPFLDDFEKDLKKFRSTRSNICKKLCFLLTFGGFSALTVYLGKKSKDISDGPSYDAQSSDFVMVAFCALASAGVSISLICCGIREILCQKNSDDIFIRDLPLAMQNKVHQLVYDNGLQPDRLLTVGDVRIYCKEKQERDARELMNFVA
jgi:hypothetical protein